MPSKKPTSHGSRKSKSAKKGAASKTAATAGNLVAVWEDDPGDPGSQAELAPINVAAPDQAARPLPFKIGGTTPAPKVYQPGTSNFRFYAAAAALRRTADFWSTIVPDGTTWEVGKTLPVVLDDGEDLNAFYTRGGFGESPGLHFFHQNVAGRTFFSGESPDVVCHEMGHAVLDAIRPQLFDAQTIEAAAFHESFGDMSAILSALQVTSFRNTVVSETQGMPNRASRLSRLAEQLGAAIRVQHPADVDADCLRNAANSFFYRDPQTLPPIAPASQLSSEPHSFSRVFTGAFLDILAGLFRTQRDNPTSNDLLTAGGQLAQILVGGVLSAPIVPDFYSQVGAHMINVAEGTPFNGKYRDVLKSAFVRRGILSLPGATTITSVKPGRASRAAFASARHEPSELPKATISAASYGLSKPTLKIHTAEEAKRFAVTSSSLTLGAIQPSSPQIAAESFTEDLFQRGRIDAGSYAHPVAGLVHPMAFKTHVIIEESGDLVLKRRAFDCGFDPA